MTDGIKHECGIALIRLLKPLSYYQEKYGSALYGLKKLYLLMEKQHNRGQDGAGVANIKFDVKPGHRYISRYRSNSSKPVQDIFARIYEKFESIKSKNPDNLNDPQWLKDHLPFTGELLLGHLRYGTYGKNSIENCHPFLRQNNWMTRNLVVAGNFNMTNVDDLFQQLVELGQHPKEKTDTITVLEKIGHFLDKENDRLHRKYKDAGHSKMEISPLIVENMDVQGILTEASKKWDGGYVIAGLIGHGDAFVLRDPAGIRPAFYYSDDEVVVVTSERPAIQTAFDIPYVRVKEIKPGHALIIRKNGSISEKECKDPQPRRSCSFERIYFSRGSDKDIYKERKALGRSIAPAVLKSVDFDLKNTVFSFIPNTAEVAYYGMMEGVNDYLDQVKKKKILELKSPSPAELDSILGMKPRMEKIAIKDVKLRTFITQDSQRDDLVAHVYDTTYGIVQNHHDNLVVIDDSIVRGTTLKESVLRILDRLKPKKIVIASSAPQIRYPDCYGIDMAKLGDFIAFRAAIVLLKERGRENFIEELYEKAKSREGTEKELSENVVKEIYEPFSADELSKKITELLKPVDCRAEVDIVFQTLDGLKAACPDHTGDWYFSGDYPTPGGNRVVNRSFINYMEGKNVRAY